MAKKKSKNQVVIKVIGVKPNILELSFRESESSTLSMHLDQSETVVLLLHNPSEVDISYLVYPEGDFLKASNILEVTCNPSSGAIKGGQTQEVQVEIKNIGVYPDQNTEVVIKAEQD